jgi:hypothetical protein
MQPNQDRIWTTHITQRQRHMIVASLSFVENPDVELSVNRW